jgi:hypothetical protein
MQNAVGFAHWHLSFYHKMESRQATKKRPELQFAIYALHSQHIIDSHKKSHGKYGRKNMPKKRVKNNLAHFLPILALGCAVMAAWAPPAAQADSDPAHMEVNSTKPEPWPGGVIPYDISKLTTDQQNLVRRAMQRWMDTGAKIKFIPRTTEVEYVNFTGKTDAGNNTSLVGFKKDVSADINITAFWWKQDEWMPAHELGHVLGFFHEHERWDRDRFVNIHYENIKPGRAGDYDWIAKTNWMVSSLPYDYQSIMHYRICWASKCESECKDGIGDSPCAVIQPVDKKYDRVIGQWSDNKISKLDAERARLVYGTK